MSDARRYAVWPEPRSRSRSLKGSRPSVPHGTNFLLLALCLLPSTKDLMFYPMFVCLSVSRITKKVVDEIFLRDVMCDWQELIRV